MVMRPEPRGTVIFSSGSKRALMKSINQRTFPDSKGDMNARIVRRPLGDPKICFGRLAKTGDVGLAGYRRGKLE